MNEHKVIGYVSLEKTSGYIFCDEDACVIAGSEDLMDSYLKASGMETPGVIKKTRYGEIKSGIMLGGKYLFDKDAWSRFKEASEKDRFIDLNTSFDEALENKFGGKMALVYKNVLKPAPQVR